MEEECSPLNWAFYYQEDRLIDDSEHPLLHSTLDPEAEILSYHHEISRKDDEISKLRGLLHTIVKEKDDYEAKLQILVLEKQFLDLQRHISEQAASPSNISNIALSPSDYCDENFVMSSCYGEDLLSMEDLTEKIPCKMPLPEKGKLLEAVMEAGPLLQTILLAGPLPRWEHPPPWVECVDVPPQLRS